MSFCPDPVVAPFSMLSGFLLLNLYFLTVFGGYISLLQQIVASTKTSKDSPCPHFIFSKECLCSTSVIVQNQHLSPFQDQRWGGGCVVAKMSEIVVTFYDAFMTNSVT